MVSKGVSYFTEMESLFASSVARRVSNPLEQYQVPC